MAITQPLILQSLLSSGSGSGVNGLSYPIIANAIATGFYTWVINPLNFQFIGTCTGTGPGTGNVFGSLVVSPNPGLILANMTSVGPSAFSVATAISTGIALVFSSGANYTGVCLGVYTGADIVTAVTVNNPVTLVAGIFSALGAIPTSFDFCNAVGNGISQMLALITGSGIITPTSTVGTVPSVGTSISSVV